MFITSILTEKIKNKKINYLTIKKINILPIPVSSQKVLVIDFGWDADPAEKLLS